MKKEYEAPKAERMEFNYTEAVVASGSVKCPNTTPMTNTTRPRCTTDPAGDTDYVPENP